MNLVDTTPRAIGGEEPVEVLCRDCKEPSKTKIKTIRISLLTRSVPYRCKKCLTKENSDRGKTLIGEKNPFYGKTHTKESIEAMSESHKKAWSQRTQNEKNAVGVFIRNEFKQKRGADNPMDLPEVQESHLASVKAFFEHIEKINERNKKRITTCIKKYGVEHPFQNPEIYEKIFGHRMSEITQKRIQTNMERHGSTCYLNSKEYKDTKIGQCDSAPERELLAFVQTFFPNAYKNTEGRFEIDIYIPELSIGIEHHGLRFHNELFKDKKYHQAKMIEADERGIKLIQIFGNEWKHKKQQVKDRLISLFGKNINKIGARECDIKEIPRSDALKFTSQYHIQGFSATTLLSIGLFHKETLVSVACFGQHHRDSKIFVLNRFCTLPGHTISGALGKISKFASSLIQKDLITWCDLRWSKGTSYLSSGWEFSGLIPPDYFYTNGNERAISKQSRKKSFVNTPKGMTEHDHSLSEGLYRVYDCGKIRFIYKYKKD